MRQWTWMKRMMICGVLLGTGSACLGGEPDASGEDEAPSCMSATDREGELFLALDTSCQTDSDCLVIKGNACGCPLPVHKTADVETYADAIQTSIVACGAARTMNCEQLGCEYIVTQETVICNAQGRCDQP